MLYKQNMQKFEIIVRKDGGSFAASGTKGLKTNQASNSQIDKTELRSNIDSDAGVKAKTLGKFIGAGLIQLTKQAIFSGFDYYVSGIGMNSGDQSLQAQINRKIEIVQDVVNVGSSIISGALMGSSLGPVGTIVGGLVGAAGSAVSIGMRQQSREREYSYQVFKENSSIQYQRARAGLNLTTGRLR